MNDIPVRKINLGFDSVKDFKIIDIEDLLKAGKIVQKTHRHDFFLLLFFNSGNGEHIIDFQKFDLKNNSAFVLRPGQVHSLTINPNSKGQIIEFNSNIFDFETSVKIRLLKKLSRRVVLECSEDEYSKLNALIRSMTTELSDKKMNFSKSINSYLNLLLIELDRIQTTTKLEQKDSYELDKFDKISDLLDKYVLEPKNVSDYAQMMNLSSFQLNKITKTVQGKTFSEILNDRKILESKRFLLATSIQIKEIAFKLGYDDVSYFSRFFKKHTDLTPIQFRNKFK